MDPRSFFITCVNDEERYLICLKHLQKLAVFNDPTMETVAIRKASSLTAGYNQAVQRPEGTIIFVSTRINIF